MASRSRILFYLEKLNMWPTILSNGVSSASLFSEPMLRDFTLKHGVSFNAHYFDVFSFNYVYFYFFNASLDIVIGFALPVQFVTKCTRKSFQRFLGTLPVTKGGDFSPVIGYMGNKSLN